MKRLLLVVLLGLFIAIAAACSQDKDKDEQESAKPKVETSETEEAESEREKEAEKESIEVDKGLMNVEVTLPASMFEGEDIDKVIAEAKEDGIKEVTVNDDGSLTYKMSKAKHKEMVEESKESLLEYIEEIKTDEDFASIKDVTHNKEFSEFTIVVDQEKFENSFDGFASVGLGISSMLLQLVNGVDPEEYKVTISLENEATGEVFDTIVYPDALNN